MSSSENCGLPYPFGKSFPHEDDISRDDRGERSIPFSSLGGNSLPPPPPIILSGPHVHRIENFKVTQALLASKHEDENFVCAHILEMKLHIDRLGMLGVIFLRKLAVELVLQSHPESYAMIWRTGQANLIGRSACQISMDPKNGKADGLEMVSSPNGEKSAMVKVFDHKTKTESHIIPCAILKKFVCFYCQENERWMRSCRIYLKDRKDGKGKMYDSTSDRRKERKPKGRVS
ncbi:hypothetical protein Lser_V15G19553 [Lactuca serriola]